MMDENSSGSAQTERGFWDTAYPPRGVFPGATEVARKVLRENIEADQTASVETIAGSETNSLGLNGGKALLLPRLHFVFDRGTEDRFISLQKWEGYVLEVSDITFSARLCDLTTVGLDEEAVFRIREVSEDDRPLLRPSAVFYWNIGDYTDVTGRQKKVSELRFRRLPPLTEADMIEARSEGKEVHRWLTGRGKSG